MDRRERGRGVRKATVDLSRTALGGYALDQRQGRKNGKGTRVVASQAGYFVTKEAREKDRRKETSLKRKEKKSRERTRGHIGYSRLSS